MQTREVFTSPLNCLKMLYSDFLQYIDNKIQLYEDDEVSYSKDKFRILRIKLQCYSQITLLIYCGANDSFWIMSAAFIPTKHDARARLCSLEKVGFCFYIMKTYL